MEEKLEFSTSEISPLLAVMYVPRCFSVKREKDGKVRAVPTGKYAGFMSEATAQEFLKKIQESFKEKGVVNFGDIEKCSLLSKDAIRVARETKSKGNSFILPAFRASDLQRMDAASLQDFERVSWYATLGRLGNDIGCLKVKTKEDRTDDGLVWFDLPGSNLRIKAGLGLLGDFEKFWGKKINFSLNTSKGITHVATKEHRRTNAKD